MSRTVNKQVDRATLIGSLPSVTVKKSRLSWALWLIPAGAVLICVWFFYRDYVASGPLITLYFENAEGLEAQNTQVNYRGASVGVVKSVVLTKDSQHVKVQARLIGAAKQLAREGTLFWIVRPELKVGSITGLRTIVSGEYIAVQPGTGPPTNSFMGSEKEPLPEEPGSLEVVLLTPSLGSLQVQSPVFYRGVPVGEITYYQLADNAHQVMVHARISHDYAPLVRANTKFWNAGGLDLHLGLFKGVQITAESPKTLISGGVEFATPPDFSSPATNDTVFELNEKPDDKWKTWVPTIDLKLPPEASPTNKPTASFLK